MDSYGINPVASPATDLLGAATLTLDEGRLALVVFAIYLLRVSIQNLDAGCQAPADAATRRYFLRNHRGAWGLGTV